MRTIRFWRRWLVWVSLAVVVLPVGWAVVAVWVPYHRTQSLIRYVRANGGWVDTAVTRPAWLEAVGARLDFLPSALQWWLIDAERELFETPTDIRLCDSSIDDAQLTYLKGLTSLDYLDLNGTHVSDAGLAYLSGLTKLEWLDLGRTQIGDAGLVNLRELANLRVLYLTGTEVSDTGLLHLRKLANLRALHLWGTEVSDAGLVHLRELANLEELYLIDTEVSDAGLAHLRGLTNLTWLELEGTEVSNEGVNGLQQALPNTYIDWSPPAAHRE